MIWMVDLKLKQGEEYISTGMWLTVSVKVIFLMNTEDDECRVHKIEIPNSVYASVLWIALLSPQPWAQQAH